MADERAAMVGGDNAERRAPPSAWQDPRTWMTLCGLLLAFLGFISSQLHDINSGIQALARSDATKTEQIATLQRRLDRLEAQHDTQEQINRVTDSRISKAEAKDPKP